MPARLITAWGNLQGSLWFIPAVITLAAALLALGTTQLDDAGVVGDIPYPLWVFGGGAEGARGVLSAIAGGVITVTGVVFSITIVVLQLASTQFTPRVLREFMANRANQVVLGVFTGTFIYALLTLRTVRSGDEDGSAFVPGLSVAIAIMFSLVSIGVLIFFVDHVARSIQASTIIDQVVKSARQNIDALFPHPFSIAGEPLIDPSPPSRLNQGEALHVTATQSGYLTHLDDDTLLDLARRRRLTIRVEPVVGDFILPGSVLASIVSSSFLDGALEKTVRSAFIVDRERTADQDLSFQITQLVDIAVKALSPGINDPKTAEMCIDRLGEILVVLGNRRIPSIVETDDDGWPLLIKPRLAYDRYADLAYDRIRHYGAASPSVAVRLLHVLGKSAALVPPAARVSLTTVAGRVLSSASRLVDDPYDLAQVEKEAGWLLEVPGPEARRSGEAA